MGGAVRGLQGASQLAEHPTTHRAPRFSPSTTRLTERRADTHQVPWCSRKFEGVRRTEVPETSIVQLIFVDPAGNGVELQFADAES